MGITTSKEMFINMKDTPVFESGKHFFEQKKHVLDFYEEERKKITEGVNIGGYHIHPWLYYHLNYFETPIPQPDGEELVMNPPLDDNIIYTVDTYREAEEKHMGACLFGTRGFSKSTTLVSLSSWLATHKANGTTSIIGGSDGDLSAISALFEIGFTNAHPAFHIPRLVSDWDSKIEFGIREKNNTKLIHSRIAITNANKGSKKESEKGAGLSPVGFIADEIGKWNPKGILQAAIPSFKTQYGAKLVHLLSGTGGNVELSKEAKEILENPLEYRLLMMNWDRLDRSCPEESITWQDSKRTPFCTYVPAQMSYRLSVPKIKKSLADHLGIKNRDLGNIDIYTTDWSNASSFIRAERKDIKKEENVNKHKMYYPTETAHCFLTSSANPFPVPVIEKRILELEQKGIIGRDVDIYKEHDKNKIEFVKKQRAAVSHGGGPIDAPIILFGEFPETPPPRGTYVSGHDGYKLDVSETDSLGTFYVIKRRNLNPNEPCETIAASYSARPPRMRTFLENGTKMIKAWDAVCCMEAVDMGLKQHMENKNEEWRYLAPSFSFTSSSSGSKYSGVTKYGIFPNKGNNEYRFNTLIDYCKEEHVIGLNDDGDPIVKLGVEYLDDLDLLKEMRDYLPGNNVDRITAFSHALVYARELDKLNVVPKEQKKKKMSQEEFSKRASLTSTNPYGVRRPTAGKGKKMNTNKMSRF